VEEGAKETGLLESAVLIRVPEAEPLVGELRRRFDPSAALGIPAHITVVYPFVPVEEVDAGIQAELRGLFAEVAPSRFELRAPARYPSVLYLKPEPDAALRAIIERVVGRFPEHPPYGGAFEDVTPHLTIAQSGDEPLLARVESELPRGLPVEVRITEAVLMTEHEDGLWRVADTFPFGGR
jgi:2'-5' RNA ligase